MLNQAGDRADVPLRLDLHEETEIAIVLELAVEQGCERPPFEALMPARSFDHNVDAGRA